MNLFGGQDGSLVGAISPVPLPGHVINAMAIITIDIDRIFSPYRLINKPEESAINSHIPEKCVTLLHLVVIEGIDTGGRRGAVHFAGGRRGRSGIYIVALPAINSSAHRTSHIPLNTRLCTPRLPPLATNSL